MVTLYEIILGDYTDIGDDEYDKLVSDVMGYIKLCEPDHYREVDSLNIGYLIGDPAKYRGESFIVGDFRRKISNSRSTMNMILMRCLDISRRMDWDFVIVGPHYNQLTKRMRNHVTDKHLVLLAGITIQHIG